MDTEADELDMLIIYLESQEKDERYKKDSVLGS